ncbi:uncharacterized protein zbtb4 [Antennarius striatus]|uniref:uncharacterized protein zbtb4 n=1 Tax=Antennarius striatus TaxID=241820 RepID=UPI0035B38247
MCRLRGGVMVSGEKVWDPHHAGLVQSRLSEQHLAAGPPPICDPPRSAPQIQRASPLSSPPRSLAAADAPPPPPPVRSCSRKPAQRPPAAPQLHDDEEEEEMKGKRQGGRVGAAVDERLEDAADGPKNAKITLSFPLSAAPLPASLTSPHHCHGASSSCASPHRRQPPPRTDEGSLWKLDATTDVKHRPFKRHEGSPSPSPAPSPMSVHALIRKDLKAPPPQKCSKFSPETQYPMSPPRASGGPLGGGYGADGWEGGHRLSNGTASPSKTTQILFNLSSAYQRGADGERRDKLTGRPAGKLGGPHGPSLHPPTLHLPPPLPPPPPPPSEGLTAPPHSSSYPPTDGLKAELICGVCHRLFSSASSLTVHMRLHRGGRALSCRYCGKTFIHSKRLASHEGACRLPPPLGASPPALTLQPKAEPLEDGEVRVEGGVAVGGADIAKARAGKKGRGLLARLHGDEASPEPPGGDEQHFVKVVDGSVIYFCSVCERSYMTLSSLKRHSNVHSWRRRYPCHYCDKVFALAEYRTKHEVWHTGERRYQCIFCWDAFATYYNLKTHQKAIHGISPALICSEKTANGGYRQKADALKLYRLLPMRAHKRPYKTYNDSLHNGLLLPPPGDAPALALPGLSCPLAPGDLQSIMGGLKPDPDAFPDGFPVSVEQRDVAALPQPPQSDVRKHDGEARDGGGGGFKPPSSSKTKTPKSLRGEASMPSVITYGHKPSVIVRGGGAASTVIVHSNQVAPASDKAPARRPSPEHKGGSRSVKVGAESPRKRVREGSDAPDDPPGGKTEAGAGKPTHKSRKSHSRGDPAHQKHPSAEAGPLCQITVRIGEEAIVKRSISETDLRRDSLPPPKVKRTDAPGVTRDARPHHHKHRPHRRTSAEAPANEGRAEAGEESGDPPHVREYFFRQGVREADSDQDDLWRPYYSYKPKRKTPPHLQRARLWQRKLQFKRSLRLKRRAERLKPPPSKDTNKSHDEEEEGKSEEAEPKADERKKPPPPEEEKATAAPRSPKPPVTPPAPPPAVRRRPWTNGNAAECGTCGCWFSSPRRRDKHELRHLLEFVCLFCRAAFPSRDKLEDHQRALHPPAPPVDGGGAKPASDGVKHDEDKAGALASSPHRLSRRALSRHTCPRCHKVCKTASALTRHARRHELSSSPEREGEDSAPKTPEAVSASRRMDPPTALSVSVISYSTPDGQSGDPPAPRHDEQREEPQGAEPDTTPPPPPAPESRPQNPAPASESVTPAPPDSTPAPPPAPQSVLVMNASECLDFRTPNKKSQPPRKAPPVTSQTRITTAAPPVSMTTALVSEGGFAQRDGGFMDRERPGGRGAFISAAYDTPPLAQDLSVGPASRSPSPTEAQDLTMSSILAREERERQRGRDRGATSSVAPNDQISLLVPKEEPLSPAPSPPHAPTQTTMNAPSPHIHPPTPPRRSPPTIGLLPPASRQVHPSPPGLERLPLPTGAVGPGERPSAHALLLPRTPQRPNSVSSRDSQQGDAPPTGYPGQNYPPAAPAPDGYRPGKKQEELLASSYPGGALPFGPLGKMLVPNGGELKLPFYPDPYQLLYGPPLLAYPYNLAALPVALNMMAPGGGDKVEPLPFLPAIFNYAAAAGPYVGSAPHALLANPGLYSGGGGGGGKKQRDSSSKP